MAVGRKGRGATLLRLVVAIAERTLPLTAGCWADELSGAAAAARVPWSRVTDELAAMQKSIDLCTRVHRAVSRAKPMAATAAGGGGGGGQTAAVDAAAPTGATGTGDGFGASMGSWLADAARTLEGLKGTLASVRSLHRACVDRLGENDGGMPTGPEVLFGNLQAFRAQWQRASALNRQAEESEAREARMAARTAEREAMLDPQRKAGEGEGGEQEVEAAGGGGGGGLGDRGARRRGGAAGRQGGGKLNVRLAVDKGGGARRQRAGGGDKGGGNRCISCGSAFLGWGASCPACRATGGRGGEAARQHGASGRGSGGARQAGAQSVEGLTDCFVCGKFCYAAERLAAGGRLFHKKSDGHRGCFRCAQCDTPLNAANFSAAGKSVYCNVHFKQLFALTGDYRFAEGKAEDGSVVAAGRPKEEVAGVVAPSPPAPPPPPPAPPSPAPPPSSRQSTLREDRTLWPPMSSDAAEAEAEADGAAPAEAEAAPLQSEEVETVDEDEPTCYVYGDLRLPFAIEEAWVRVRDSSTADNFVVVSYAPHDANLIEVVGSGDGGLPACIQLLTDPTRIFYGGLCVLAVDTRRGVRSVRPKFIFFSLFGRDVSTRERTRGLLDMGAIAEIIQQTHCSIEVEEVESGLSAEGIAEKLLQSGELTSPTRLTLVAGWSWRRSGISKVDTEFSTIGRYHGRLVVE